jgi:Protein of unknown function (DUF3489)
MSAKLTDTQQLLLKVAAERGDRCLVLPSTLKGGAAHKVAARLIAAGLVREIRAKPELPVWRRDEGAGLAYSLKLTAAGAKAIANDEVAVATEPQEASGARRPAVAAAPAASHDAANPGAPASAVSPRDGTKIALVVGLIQRSVGATLDELVASTGWLPHTTRAAALRSFELSPQRIGVMIFVELRKRVFVQLVQDFGELRCRGEGAREMCSVNLAKRADERIAVFPADFPVFVAMSMAQVRHGFLPFCLGRPNLVPCGNLR